MKSNALVIVLAVLVGVLAALLVTTVVSSRPAAAQVSEGSTDFLTAILGPEAFRRVPLFIVDSKSQTIMVYEYDQSTRKFYMRAARSFRYDRRLEEADYSSYGQNKGPSLRDVQKKIRD